MALNQAALLTIAFNSYDKATKFEAKAYAGFVTTFLNNTVWAMPGAVLETKVLKARMTHFAVNTMEIKLTTWQAYIGAVEGAAKKLAENLAGQAFDMVTGTAWDLETDRSDNDLIMFDDIRDMTEQAAVKAISKIMYRLNLPTGGEIRDWAKASGFEPLDKVAIAAARKAETAAKKIASVNTDMASWLASSGTDSSADKVRVAASKPADPVASIAAMLATLTMEQRLSVQDALSTLLVSDATVSAAALASIATVEPEIVVLPDTVDETVIKAKRTKRTAKSLGDLATAMADAA